MMAPLSIFLIAACCFAPQVPAVPNGPGRVTDIETSAENPRNSEGAFITLRDGTIVFAYTRFRSGSADEAPAEIVALRSIDGGATWGRDPVVIVPNEGRQNVMSVSLLRLDDGRIALFYLRKNGLRDCRLFLRTSGDEGATWSAPSAVIDAPGYFTVNNDRVVRLRGGRLVVPASLHRSRSRESDDMKFFDERALALFFLSDDGGRTWREAEDWWGMPVRSRAGLQEPGIVELTDGRLFAWARTDVGAQYGLLSGDGGVHWDPPFETAFKSPNSPLSMKRIPSTGDLLAVWNDHSGRFPFDAKNPASWGRSPLVSAVSRDDGKTWENARAIETDPDHGYCYTAIHFTGDAVLLAYCAGGPEMGGVLVRLRIRRVPISWFYEADGPGGGRR